MQESGEPIWRAGRVRQEAANEEQIATGVRDVVLTLRTMGVNRSQAMLTAYQTTYDVIQRTEYYSDLSPLARVSVTCRILRMAFSPLTRHAAQPALQSHENAPASRQRKRKREKKPTFVARSVEGDGGNAARLCEPDGFPPQLGEKPTS